MQSTLSYIALKQPRLNALIEREVPSTLSHIPEEQTPSILFREREVPYTLSHITRAIPFEFSYGVATVSRID